MDRVDVSIIIVNYKSALLVSKCIESIFQKTEGIKYEIIVVDNDSKDGSIEVLEKSFGNQIILVDAHENLGFGKANNLGAQYASGKYLFLLNPDTYLINNAIMHLKEFMEDHRKAGVVGGNLYSHDMEPCPSYSLLFDNLKGEYKKSLWATIIKNKIVSKVTQNNSFKLKPYRNEFNYSGFYKKVAYIFGADMMVRKNVFDKVNGFDPDFFMYAEEEDLSWRITSLGYDIWNVPYAKIVHLEGATTKSGNSFNKRQFLLRMGGAFTYFYKRYGEKGVHIFYRMRSRQYCRLLRIDSLRGKETERTDSMNKLRCLDKAYQDYLKILEEKNG